MRGIKLNKMTINSYLQLIKRRCYQARSVLKADGLRALIRLILNRLLLPSKISGLSLINFYDFVRVSEFKSNVDMAVVSKKSVNWVVPPFGFGSGGHLNIFRFIQQLEKDGFDCRIIIVGKPRSASIELVKKQINDWFVNLNANIYLDMQDAPPAHITIATSWQTAYYVRNFQSTVHRCYFVQDYEPLFYAAGSEYAWAEETYRFGFYGITAGSWLSNKLINEYGMKAEAFGFSYDRNLYTPRKRNGTNAKRVFFYARPPTQRRAFEMGILILNEVARRLPDVEFNFAGWDVSGYEIPFKYINSGTLKLDDLPELYSQCDVALVLSFTNVSLLPLELMACGVPVVSNRAPCTEWLLNDSNAKLSAPTVEALADAVCEVLQSDDEAMRLRSGGFASVAETNWDIEGKKVSNILRNMDSIRK